jgi:hypothetical protein
MDVLRSVAVDCDEYAVPLTASSRVISLRRTLPFGMELEFAF